VDHATGQAVQVICQAESHRKGRTCKISRFTRTPDGWHAEYVGDVPGRYRLECKLCGLTLARRPEHLDPILDRLAEAGVWTISLDGLIKVPVPR
jgi:hypothetical protein